MRKQAFSVTARNVLSISASVRGGDAELGLMSVKLTKAIQQAHNPVKGRVPHRDIAQIFYDINREIREDTHNRGGGFSQTCEMRSTLTKMLNLTQIFKPPSDESQEQRSTAGQSESCKTSLD